MIVCKENMQRAYTRLRTGHLPPGTSSSLRGATVAVLDMAARGHAHTNRLGRAMETDEMITFIMSFETDED